MNRICKKCNPQATVSVCLSYCSPAGAVKSGQQMPAPASIMQDMLLAAKSVNSPKKAEKELDLPHAKEQRDAAKEPACL